MSKRIVSGIMLTLLLSGMFTLAFNIRSIEASGTIYIKADGSIDPPTAPISTFDNFTYTFTANISEMIVIERSNITVDGNGYTLQGPGMGYGFTLSGINNVTIQNTDIKSFLYGVYLYSSSNNTISGNNITANLNGIYLFYSSSNLMSGNNMTNNHAGISLSNSSNNRFFHNNFVDNAQQVYIYSPGYANFWDDGYPSGGNYWSDYTGVDLYTGPFQNETGSDGIGDTPYIIDEDNQDHYPLMPESKIDSKWMTIAPTIDGVIGPDEWSDAEQVAISLVNIETASELGVDLFTKNNDDFLCMAFKIPDPTQSVIPGSGDILYLYFDQGVGGGERDGILTAGNEDEKWWAGSQAFQDFFFDGDEWQLDVFYGGSQDGDVFGGYHTDHWEVEWMIPMASGDKLDLNVEAGTTVGILIQYREYDTTLSYGWPIYAGYKDASNWAGLTLARPPKTIIVPDDYPTIQEAVNAAGPGNTIVVRDGTYNENVDVNKSLKIRSEYGPANCTVQAASSSDHVFEVTADNVTIIGFTVKGASGTLGAGIHLHADSSIVENNNASNNYYGIDLWSSSNNKLTNNSASNNIQGVSLIFSSNNTITQNTMSGNIFNFGVYGTKLSHFMHNIDTSNQANGKPIYYLVNEKNMQIPNDAGYVGIVNSTNITVKDLTLTNNVDGVLLAYSGNCRIENINTSNNGRGIGLRSSTNNVMVSNTMSGDTEVGICLWSSTNNIITNNIISNNGIGLFLRDSSNNRIFHNNFIGCAQQVDGYNSASTWDDGYPSGGNYWSDYTYLDLHCGPNQNVKGRDGIWDHPYVIDVNNTDNYPLVKPYKPGNLTVSIYVDKYTYHVGDTMHLGLSIANPDSVKYLDFAIWVKRPGGSIYVYMYKDSIVLPIGTDYSDPSFDSITLPGLPPGTYTWHAAFLKRGTHKIIVENTAEWEFV